MDILIKPDKLSLSGSMNHLVMNSVKDVSLVLKQDDTGAVILQHTYSPDNLGRIEVDLGDVISPLLSFSLKDVSEVYEQTAIIRSFTIEATELGTEVPTSWTFSVIRAGIDHFSDSASNFLQANFLTWQPTVKPVTYYTPEFLTYYSAVDTKVCCKSYVSKDNAYTETLVTLSMLTAGKVWTIPVQYAVIASKVNALPAYYDVWVETTDGTRLTYIQRYYASDLLSEQEQWVLFENSLGGIDTFRAYGLSENTAKHTHNIAEIEQDATEYRVDTEREYKKSTGNLGKYERRWLLDFFPSLGKYVYADTFIRRIVVTDSDVTYRSTDLPSSYTFTYRYADARPYLNLARNSQPLDSGSLLAIEVPDVGSFTIAPRLVEFERLSLSSGALFPVQGPYADHWSVTTIASIIDYLSSELLSAYKNDGSLGHTHANISVLSALSRIGQYLLLDGSKINAGLSDQATGLTKDSPEWDKILRKDIPNNAQELIRFLKGIVFGDGSKGIDAGGNATLAEVVIETIKSVGATLGVNGLMFTKNENGDEVLQVPNLSVLHKFSANEIQKRILSAVGGSLLLSPASSKLESVVPIDELGNIITDATVPYAYKCYIKTDDGTTATTNTWMKGDQARFETFDLRTGVHGQTGNRFYWRTVTEVTEKTDTDEAYIVLSNEAGEYEGTDAPSKGDTPVACGVNRVWWDSHPDNSDPQLVTPYPAERASVIMLETANLLGGGARFVMYDTVSELRLNEQDITADISRKGVVIASNKFTFRTPTNELVPQIVAYPSYDGTRSYHYYAQVPYDGQLWLCVAENGSTIGTPPSENNAEWVRYVKSGGSGWRIEGFSSAGSAAYTEGQTSWTAQFDMHIWRDDVEVTSNIATTRFIWTRVSEYPDGDVAWNDSHANIGSSLSATYSDLYGDTSFICDFVDDNGMSIQSVTF